MKETKLSVDTGTFIRFWLVILGFAAVIGAIWLARNAVVLVLVSFFLALVLNRPVSFIARHMPGRSRIFATLIAYLLIVALIMLVFFNLVPIFVKQISLFLSNLPATLQALQNNSQWFNDFLNQYNLTNQFDEWLVDMQKQLGSIASSVGGSFIAALSGLASAMVSTLFVSVLTFLMLIEGPTWEEKFWRLAYRNANKRRRHQELARKMYNVVSDYVSGQTALAALSGTFSAILIVILAQFFPEVETGFALTAWLLVFLTMFIPMFGAFIGGGVVTLLLALYAWPAAVIFVVLFTIEQQIENNIIQPKIQSKKLNMSALVVLLAVIFGLQIAGLLGALVAIPVAGIIMVWLRDVMSRRRIRLATEWDKAVDPGSDRSNMSVVFVQGQRKPMKSLAKIGRKLKKKSQRNREK
ncbi:AI-2E family transporter [Candidatus Saccharibacteria bacterium]|nr:AI-2E family transporter [Candidatus Saccharibacteria bacterium]